MKIIVKRFCLSHNGEIYKAGDVVEIEDPKTAKRLVARSGGTLEIYNSDEVEDVEDSDNGDNEDGDNEDGDNEDGDNGDDDAGDGGVSDDVSDSDSEDSAGGIPAVDPAAAVQTDNTSPKGKGRGKGK